MKKIISLITMIFVVLSVTSAYANKYDDLADKLVKSFSNIKDPEMRRYYLQVVKISAKYGEQNLQYCNQMFTTVEEAEPYLMEQTLKWSSQITMSTGLIPDDDFSKGFGSLMVNGCYASIELNNPRWDKTRQKIIALRKRLDSM